MAIFGVGIDGAGFGIQTGRLAIGCVGGLSGLSPSSFQDRNRGVADRYTGKQGADTCGIIAQQLLLQQVSDFIL